MIPLDDELFTDMAPFIPFFLHHPVEIRLRFAKPESIVLSSDPTATYKITNFCLEWDGVLNRNLAIEVNHLYKNGFDVPYDRVQSLNSVNYPKSYKIRKQTSKGKSTGAVEFQVGNSKP